MKKQVLAVLTGIIITFSIVAGGCAGASTNAKTETETTVVAEESTEAAETNENGEPDGMDKPEAPGDGKNGGTPPDMPPGGGMGGADTQTFDYKGDYNGALEADGEEVTSDGESVSATDTDQNAALAINGGTLKITKGTLNKSGDDDNGDNCNFYGLNAIAVAVGSDSKMYISDSSLEADSEGSNAIFATDNATIYAKDTTIHTTSNSARGLDATYGGNVIAENMTIDTEGDHCATIATDRGGGNISVTDSKLTTKGSGSPILYSTGNIQVDGVTGTSSGSQIAGMEGLNTILIKNSSITSTVKSKTASDPVANGVIIYQSMSGDAETTTGDRARFQAVDSELTSLIEEGAMFYITNTDANVVLSNTKLEFNSEKAKLLAIEGNDSNGWGTAGKNGGTVTFTGNKQSLNGDISVDTISSLDFYLLNGSTWTGSAEVVENAVNTDKTDSPITINVDSTSTWTVTADSTITNLNVEDGGKIVDGNGKTVTIIANGKTVVKGDSDITVTVTGEYGTTVTTDEANEISEDYIDRTDFNSYFG